MRRLPFRKVYAVDFEFCAPPGERPTPLCVVAKELHSGALIRHWLAGGAPESPPFDICEDALFVAYYASAELGCHLALDWPMPARILDLYAEFRCLTSGLSVPCGRGLLGALAYFGLDGIGVAEKEEMRTLAMRGGHYSDAERLALLGYCQSDVDALTRLLPAMLPKIDLPRALLRGRYMAAAARMEWNGVPIDTDTLQRLRENWEPIKARLIHAVNKDYGVFVPVNLRTINPESRTGAAILETATEWDIDPHKLADVVDYLWQREREANGDVVESIRKARQATGLTVNRIRKWEESGYDHTTYPGLDVTAQGLAGELPALGIGGGYTSEDEYETRDQAGELWNLLREDRQLVRPKGDPGLLREAAEIVSSAHDAEALPTGPMRFSAERWAAYLTRKNIPWPRLESGALDLSDDTFREMARAHPREVGPIRELRHTLSQLRLNELSVGTDGRNRCLLSAFQSRTGRNQPSNAKFIFGPSCWFRSLIQPEPGRAVAYCDWSAQELGIAAALSGDPQMKAAYQSGDPYIWLAIHVGAVPPDATKKTHAAIREQFKVVSLGVLYGLSAEGLARKLNVPPCYGWELLRMHQQTFRVFWEWSDRIETEAMFTGRLRTVFGWAVNVGREVNPRSLRNFPMQGNGAEMMRLACCFLTERGIRVCAPIHDALLVEGSADGIVEVVDETTRAMREASEVVLPGFPLRSEAKVIRYPERYSDGRGRQMWQTVMGLMEEETPIAGDTLPLSPVIPPSPLIYSLS
jgi:DNA polymerase family A